MMLTDVYQFTPGKDSVESGNYPVSEDYVPNGQWRLLLGRYSGRHLQHMMHSRYAPTCVVVGDHLLVTGGDNAWALLTNEGNDAGIMKIW